MTFTEKKDSNGDSNFGITCYKKLDPPTLRFARQPGECARVDGQDITKKTVRDTVASASECQAICQKFFYSCRAFSFESKFGTCHTFEDISELQGDLKSDRVCHIRLTD